MQMTLGTQGSRTPRGDEMQMTLGTQALHKVYVLVDCVGGGGGWSTVLSHTEISASLRP